MIHFHTAAMTRPWVTLASERRAVLVGDIQRLESLE
jgi:hypothetical protein